MHIKLYDLEKDNSKFKADFSHYTPIKKIMDVREENEYHKIDLVVDEDGTLFVCKRQANYTTGEARMDLDPVEAPVKVEMDPDML